MSSDFSVTSIGTACEITTGFPFRSSDYCDKSDSIKLLRGDNIAQGNLRWDGVKRWNPENLERSVESKYSLKSGDVIIAMDRPWIEAGLKFAAIQDSDLPCLLVQRVACLRAGEKVDQRYLKYVISDYSFTNHVLAVQTGTAVPHISSKQIAEYEFAAPPLSEQKAIAHILGTLDDKIELNRKTNETLEAMAKALFKSWFVDFDPVRAKAEGRPTGLPAEISDLFPDSFEESELGEIPSGWRSGDLNDLADLNPESWSAKNHPSELIYVDLSGTKNGKIEEKVTFEWSDAPSRARRVLKQGDTIVGTVRPGNKSFSLVQQDGLTGSTGFAVVRPKELFNTSLLYIASTSDESIDRLAHLADGGAYPAVRPDVVMETPITVPSQPIQMLFGELTDSLLRKISVNERESEVLEQLRDVLLPRLVSGELRVPDAEKMLEEVGV